MFNKSLIFISLCLCLSLSLVYGSNLLSYRASPKLHGPSKIGHANDVTLNKLDNSLAQISTIYMKALFAGTHTPELDMHMSGLEIELYDLLHTLYKEQRLGDYIKYENEVTRQMILYNMLKKLFGYGGEDNERIK